MVVMFVFALLLIGCEANQNNEIVINDIEDEIDVGYVVKGNTTGNIANGGIAVPCGESVYFSNGLDGGKIYKVDIAKSEVTQINNCDSRYLNISDGWLYYSNFDENSRIEKFQIGGKEAMTVKNDHSENIIVLNEWIYYINKSDQSRVYRVNIDGSERERISEDGVTEFGITEEWIYYVNIGGVNTRKIYKIKLDGSERTQLNEHHSRYINIADDWIYYTGQNTAFPEPSYIYKMNKDGSNNTLVSMNDANNLNVVDDWIYYSNWDDGYSIYKIGIDGNQNTKLNDHSSRNINVTGDWIFYISANEDNTYRMRTGGSEMAKIIDNAFELLEDIKAAEPYSDIQEAIDAAETGDTVVIEPGIYEGDIDFKGKEIKLLSTDPQNPDIVASTVIKGSGNGSVVTFQNGEGKGAVLSGFTITGGTGTKRSILSDGGGIFIRAESSPIIENNVIIGNQSRTGGGISVIMNSSPEIRSNIITENEAEQGGGIAVSGSIHLVLEDNIINQNKALRDGGGVSFDHNASATLKGNIVSDNEAGRIGGGLYAWFEHEGLIIEENTFDGNKSVAGGAIGISESSDVVIKSNIIKNNIGSSTGGGISVYGDSIIIDNLIKGNSSKEGGAISCYEWHIEVRGNTIERNTSEESGGGIFINGGSADIVKNIFEENKSGEFGGGIFIDYHVLTLNVEGNDFIRNHAIDGGGAIWAIESGEFYISWAEGVGDYVDAEINISDANYYFFNKPDNVYMEERKTYWREY